MSKKRASIRGRGSELLGRGVDALFSGTTPPKAATPAESTEAELNAMLAVEANNATHDGQAKPSPTIDAATRRSPDAATSKTTVTIAGEGVSLTEDELMDAIDVPLGEGPQAFPPYPQPEPESDTTPNIRPEPSPVAPAPAPSPTPATPKSAPVPPRPRVHIGGQLSEVVVTPGELDNNSVRPPSPFIRPSAPPVEEPLPPSQLSPSEQERILAQVNQERLDELHKRIDQLYRDVPKRISNRPDLTAQILGMLRQARTILIEHPYDYIEAEYKIQQAYAIYNRVENSEKWGDLYGWRVFWFEVITFFVLLFSFLSLLAFGNDISAFLAKRLGATEATQGLLTAVGFWSTFVWGGIGGVVGALYTLWTHVSERQDFERQHVMWYTAQPIMGLILGGVTFLVINTGLLSLQGGQTAAAALREDVQLFPSLIAFIAGFRPQFIFGLLVKIIKLINPTSES